MDCKSIYLMIDVGSNPTLVMCGVKVTLLLWEQKIEVQVLSSRIYNLKAVVFDPLIRCFNKKFIRLWLGVSSFLAWVRGLTFKSNIVLSLPLPSSIIIEVLKFTKIRFLKIFKFLSHRWPFGT